jgi:two-component system sensor histidine kinase/response regulator
VSAADRILIVDDNPRNILILQHLLADFTLCCATTGEEALERAVQFEPHLVLLDIMLPGIDGYETCRRLRGDAQLTCTPKIIMVSARAMVNERLKGYEAGADDYVTKPFDQDELLAKVKVYLRLQSLEQFERLQGDLVTLLDEDTRTPIACLLSATDALRQLARPTVEAGELMSMIDGASRQLGGVIGKIVVLSSLRTATLKLDRRPADLSPLVSSVVEAARRSAEAKDVRLESTVCVSAPSDLDARLGELVLAPLLENAIRFTNPGGRVAVSVAPDPTTGEAVVAIADDGCGMPASVFSGVTRGHIVADIRDDRRGSGLSLPAARLFVQAHGGRFEVTSAVGEGTRVTLRFPAVAGKQQEAGPLAQAA